ncbi:hypothetical protein GTO89_09570 [Heliobacterium gestii]|uniref:Prepilin-type N-terminal cleavage/methylation domain-containing protein n=1 Tax=Heliomicrobium gestii TaxID=2699 RepID=A0A845LK99_HELGE|nr:hypothetical protein [Heliomicrobium gestii]MBM7867902.1 hypothetical protein [Heliomicrobium gestii]MZP43286.1 hypothetical protein [Heliomicrobium gestii]
MSDSPVRKEKGSILAEALIALLLLGLIALPLYGVMTVAERLERRSERFAQMLALAQQVLEVKRALIKGDPTQVDSRLPAGITIPEGFRCVLTVGDATDPPGLRLKEVAVTIWDQAMLPPEARSDGAEPPLSSPATPVAAGAKCVLVTLVAPPDRER